MNRKVFIYAHGLRKNNPNLNLSTALRMAWSFIKKNPTVKVLSFKKVNSEKVTNRIVSENWQQFHTFKGTGKPLKEGQKLFADLAKVATGKRPIISTYKNRIVALAA